MSEAPVFEDGIHCQHGYPPGEYCPACGELPTIDCFHPEWGYDREIGGEDDE